MSLGNNAPPAAENGADPPPNGTGPASASPTSAAPGAGADVSRKVQEVLESDIGVSTMLNRLKQSIASAKEFALFLKKRSVIEDEHAKGMKKLCRMTQENIHLPDHRQGSFGRSYEEMLHIHDRMAENGMQFALSLHQMHEDLIEVAAVAEKHRKGWKQNGLAAEQRLADIEAAMRKSKSKYDSLADEYDRVRTGDTSGRKGFGFKGPKSAAQQEEDLLRKVQAADSDYHSKVDTYQAEKRNIVATTRPEAIKALQDLVRECDSGTTLQLQKFASFNEKLLLSNGLVISPLKNLGPDYSHHPRSLKEVIHAVDNKKDLDDYLLSYHSKVPSKLAEPKYERNAVLNPQPNPISGMQPPSQPGPPSSFPMAPAQAPGSMSSRTGPYGDSVHSGGPGGQPQGGPSFNQPPPQMSGGQGPPPSQGHERSVSHGGLSNQSGSMSQQQQQQPPQNFRNSTQPASHSSRYNGGTGSISSATPPQLGALPFQSQTQQPQPRQQSPSRQTAASLGNPLQQHPPTNQSASVRSISPPAAVGPTKPMFGISLQRLYERDGLAVPMVVYQCIQAVDLFGLTVEGIYRLSGSQAHVTKLKGMFDADSDNRNLDFRNPENFFHDVNSVAGLLKQFFRDLPDPLLTAEHYQAFIDSAKNEDEIVRRDSLHAIINSLPDPNYATLRALTLHLHRVIEAAGQNRMNSQNLAIVFGPTLMGNVPGGSLADAPWQVTVVDTILQNTYQIFDED